MDEDAIKTRNRSNPARVLVFDDAKPHIIPENPKTLVKSVSQMDSPTSQSKKAETNSEELQNLVIMRNSYLGKSAPSLSMNVREVNFSRRNSRPTAIHRLSFATNTSPILPRSHSPVCASPIDSPRTHTSFINFSFAPIKRIVAGYRGDGRRWSVASLPSSGYGTTPGSSNVSSKCSSQERLHQIPNIPISDDLKLHNHNFSSNESDSSLPGTDYELNSINSPLHRPRSRSFSSSTRSPIADNEICMMNIMYKERFPKATQQMEEKLETFIKDNKCYEIEEDCSYLPIVRFVLHQVIEMARDCLHKSQNKMITSQYFYEMSENLEKLLSETREKSEEAANLIYCLIKKVLLIISRPARLLECLEFDPEEFYHFLQEAEGQVKVMQEIKTDIPQYIIQKLGLNRNPVSHLQQELCENNWSNSSTRSSLCGTSTPSNKKKKMNPNQEDFEVIKLISNGAYGAVYLVKHKQSRQRYALKKINKNNLMLRNQVEQVFAERDILSFADNPFVVSMYCSFETKKHLCLVLEYVEGGDCASLLKNIGPLPPEMAKFYFAETVLAVEYLHSYGIVHRDLKPDNLLITAFGHIKLTDFGLSKMGLMSLATNLYEGYIDVESRQFSDKQVFGTPEYIAPEVILRQGYGKPVDWWSMGIILYEFLIGCVPFFGDTPEELFAHSIQGDFEWPVSDDWTIQEEAKDIITALLQHSPRDRLGTGGAHEVKEHPYFHGVDWNSLLRQKAEFVPQLENDEDTSYFDSRIDRYSHEMEDDTDDTDDSPVFGLFSSCSPQYRKFSKSASTTLDLDITSSSCKNTVSDNSTDSNEATSDYRIKLPAFTCSSSVQSPDVDRSISGDSRLLNVSFCMTSTPESSQTDIDEVTPNINRRKKSGQVRDIVPRFSISLDDGNSSAETGTSSSENKESSPLRRVTSTSSAIMRSHKSKPVVKSASATGLSLIISSEDFQTPLHSVHSPSSGGGSSTASSRDPSPCRELSPLVTTLKPPIIIRRGPRGFGFTVHTIRVYYGDTDIYTMHHLVMAVDEGSPAFEAGLRPADLITHINGETIQGLYHTQVLQLLLGGPELVSLRATPLEQTSIKTGGRKREPGQSKLAKRSLNRQKKQKKETDKRRKTSLFRRISSKRASAEIQQMTTSIASPVSVTPSRSFQSFPRTNELSFSPPLRGNTNRSVLSPSDPFKQYPGSSCQVLAPSSSAPSIGSTSSNGSSKHYQRPSTLHGLKHKLHSQSPKPLHPSVPSCPTSVPNRRKSVGHIPLSPLARTPSPSPLPASPTRSPSPLAFPIGHQPGSSNTTQSYSPSAGSTPVTVSTQPKKGFVRPKAAEPGSPLLRRALSPDRLHPRLAENKCSISPLCSSSSSSNLKSQGSRLGSNLIWRHNSHTEKEKEQEEESNQVVETAINLPASETRDNRENRLSLNLSGPGEFLPRITEEKDSPTGTQEKNDKLLDSESCDKSRKLDEFIDKLNKNDTHYDSIKTKVNKVDRKDRDSGFEEIIEDKNKNIDEVNKPERMVRTNSLRKDDKEIRVGKQESEIDNFDTDKPIEKEFTQIDNVKQEENDKLHKKRGIETVPVKGVRHVETDIVDKREKQFVTVNPNKRLESSETNKAKVFTGTERTDKHEANKVDGTSILHKKVKDKSSVTQQKTAK